MRRRKKHLTWTEGSVYVSQWHGARCSSGEKSRVAPHGLAVSAAGRIAVGSIDDV